MTLPLREARRNDEVISLADSQMLRWIDELNGVEDADERAFALKRSIKKLRSEEESLQKRRELRAKYEQLDAIQFKSDYMCLIIDKEKDYHRAVRGFSINGVTYRRLLGTNGGIKNSTIVFVSDRLHDALASRVDNGRDMSKELVPAKLEAYKALTCSASIPVSWPDGILVIHDCETAFKDDIIYMDDDGREEPMVEHRKDADIKLDASDGFGMMRPDLAERWSRELGLSYVTSGVNTRCAFTKGMVFTFDFVKFAQEKAKSFEVKDVWGNVLDIRQVQLVLTESMLKLWDSYESCEAYIKCCKSNNYTFGVAKTCPERLEDERRLNYQFIQSFGMDDDDIEELIAPTMNEMSDVLSDDWRRTVLFLKGSGLTESNAVKTENDFAKAIMIWPEILKDPFVYGKIRQMIKNRIDEAKVGVLNVHGNYSIASGDPYALCQSMFGMDVTGLLRRGEIFNRYWAESDAEKLVCFRAPMSCHNNVRKVKVRRGEEVDTWFRYMNACTVMNAWDNSMAALNGMDFDGDLVMLTDNSVLLRRHEEMPALVCAQRKAKKKVVTEEDVIQSNIDSFGNDIGKTTNYITSMYEVRSRYEKDSKEYEELSYRIQCGQLFQQNAIDKAKGIVCKPMPRSWHDWHSVNMIEDEEKKRFYRSILAEKKPYFMRYIYPSLAREFNTYRNSTDKNALREFGMTVCEMKRLPYEELTERQKEFLHWYDKRLPVGDGKCVMNQICRRFEERFDGRCERKPEDTKFDYSMMKSGTQYSVSQAKKIAEIYEEYNREVRSYAMFAKYEKVDTDTMRVEMGAMRSDFIRRCSEVCQNRKVMCDVVLDVCYTKSATKAFAWSVCADQMIENLLENCERKISFPTRCDGGEFTYGGERYTVKTVVAEDTDECDFE